MHAVTSASTNPPGAAILVEEVWKSFPRRRPVKEVLSHPFRRPDRVSALEGVSLEVARGEIVGLLGPNGAGKTTLLKTLCGLVLPERGRVEVLGVPAGSNSLARVLGLVHGEERSFYWRLTARENLEFYARLHGIPTSRRAGLIDRLLERVRLLEDANRRFGDFSSGMRQRMAIARALLADPPVLLMDEPTRSLDPVSASELREWIADELHRRDRKAILIATHNLKEAETLCQRVVILASGVVRAAARPADLQRQGLSGEHYRLIVQGLPEPGAAAGIEWLEAREEAGSWVLLAQLGEGGLDELLRRVHGAGGQILECRPEVPDLETVFHRLVRGAGSPEGAG